MTVMLGTNVSYSKCNSNAALSKLYKVPKENMLGRKVMINSYSVHFPCDKQTVVT